MKRIFTPEEIADIKNARGCNVSWNQLGRHYGCTADDVRAAVDQPRTLEPVKNPETGAGMFE